MTFYRTPYYNWSRATLPEVMLKQSTLKAAIKAQSVRQLNPETEASRQRDPETSTPHRTQLTKLSPETDTPQSGLEDKYLDFIGDTPLVDLSALLPSGSHPGVRVYAKCEFFNPGFSIKDRIVRNILGKAEAQGALKSGMTVVAASSGNTGASTAMMCAMKGYKCIITTSPKCSDEKQRAIKAYGAQLLLSPCGAKEGSPEHYMEMARLLASESPDLYFDMDQYETSSNPEGHYLTLGPEILEQTAGRITHFVAAGSTGGTISGTGKFLKENLGDVQIVLADPVGSIFTNFFNTGTLGQPSKFLVEGVGKGSIPGAMDFKVIDSVIPVSDDDAFSMCHILARTQGICAGGSSGLNVFAAIELGSQQTEPAVIVTVLPDLGVKYLSKVYNHEWLKENGIQLDLSSSAGSSVSEEDEVTISKSMRYSFDEISSCRYLDLVGRTPMINLTHLVNNQHSKDVKLFAKCEFFNPGFSIKDRIVQNILNKAEADGRLKEGMTVIAASSGNTGASTAMMCAARGYKCIITTSPKCSKEKMDAITAYGAELIVSPSGVAESSPQHYMQIARLKALESPDLFFDMDQYDSQSNPEGHYLTLAPEIWEQSSGSVTHFVAAGSTGGTISGTCKFLKQENPEIKSVLADPIGSIFAGYFKNGTLSKPGKFLVEGVGKGSIPGAMDFGVIDSCISISDQEAFDTCFYLCRNEGICVGGSSGLNLCAALKCAQALQDDATIVTVFPDLGVKYLSKIYNNQWLIENGLTPPV